MTGGRAASAAPLIELRRMRDDEGEIVRAFMPSCQPAERPQPRPGWLEWQYVDNPDGSDVRLCHEGGRLVAMSGFIPCAVVVDGIGRRAAFSTNTLVAPASRGRGVGRLIHEARLADYDWALSSGQSPANERLYRRLGFVVAGEYRQFLAQTRFPRPRPRLRFVRELVSWLRWCARSRGASDLTVQTGTAAPDVPDTCYRDRFADDAVGPTWNRAHVVWRYERHPYFTHQFATVGRSGTPIGFAVLRRARGVMVMVDLYARHADQVDVLEALAVHIEEAVTGQFVGRALERVFRRAGWTTFRGANRLLGKSSDHVRHELLLGRSWCFFGGDSDSDR